LISNVDFLKYATPENISKLTGESEEKVKALLVGLLFCRLSTCLKHHKEDFETYIEFWSEITR
jgi:hypothetical protein